MKELGMVIVNAWSKIPAISESLAANDNTQLYLALGIICLGFTIFGAVYLGITCIRFFYKQSQMEKNGEEGRPWKILINGFATGLICIAFPWLCSLLGTIVGLFY